MSDVHYQGKQVTLIHSGSLRVSNGIADKVYVKQCKCTGTSTTDRFYESSGIVKHTDGPVCDVCHIPWKQDDG